MLIIDFSIRYNNPLKLSQGMLVLTCLVAFILTSLALTNVYLPEKHNNTCHVCAANMLSMKRIYKADAPGPLDYTTCITVSLYTASIIYDNEHSLETVFSAFFLR